MDDFAARLASWDTAGRSPRARHAIAPERNRPEGYEASGARHAAMLSNVVARHDRRDHATLDVLDFGCGDGRVACHLARTYATVTGADASPAMLTRLAVACPDVTPLRWDGATPAERDWDVVCSFLVLIHHRHADGARILANLATAVRPGGLLAVQRPLYATPREPRGWHDVGAWTTSQLLAVAENVGLQVLETHANGGAYRPGRSGAAHGRLQVFRRD